MQVLRQLNPRTYVSCLLLLLEIVSIRAIAPHGSEWFIKQNQTWKEGEIILGLIFSYTFFVMILVWMDAVPFLKAQKIKIKSTLALSILSVLILIVDTLLNGYNDIMVILAVLQTFIALMHVYSLHKHKNVKTEILHIPAGEYRIEYKVLLGTQKLTATCVETALLWRDKIISMPVTFSESGNLVLGCRQLSNDPKYYLCYDIIANDGKKIGSNLFFRQVLS